MFKLDLPQRTPLFQLKLDVKNLAMITVTTYCPCLFHPSRPSRSEACWHTKLWAVAAKEEELVEQWDVTGYIFSTVQNLAECNSTYSPKETCLDLRWLLLIPRLHLEVDTQLFTFIPSGARQWEVTMAKKNKSQCLGTGSLPEAIYNVVNSCVVSRFLYINKKLWKSEKKNYIK